VRFHAQQQVSLQNTSSAGDTVKRLGAESDDQVQQIQQNVDEHKKAVSERTPASDARPISGVSMLAHCSSNLRLTSIL